jgi:hypothetical protein
MFFTKSTTLFPITFVLTYSPFARNMFSTCWSFWYMLSRPMPDKLSKNWENYKIQGFRHTGQVVLFIQDIIFFRPHSSLNFVKTITLTITNGLEKFEISVTYVPFGHHIYFSSSVCGKMRSCCSILFFSLDMLMKLTWKIQCNLDLVTILVPAKTVTKLHNVTKSNDFM